VSKPIPMTLDPETGRWRAPCGCEVNAVPGLTGWRRDWEVTLYLCAGHGIGDAFREARRRMDAAPVTDARAREARQGDL